MMMSLSIKLEAFGAKFNFSVEREVEHECYSYVHEVN